MPSVVPPLGGSAVSSSHLSGEHSPVSCRAPLFAALPNGAPALRRENRSFLVDLVPRQLGFYFALSASFLQPVRHSLRALLDVRSL